LAVEGELAIYSLWRFVSKLTSSTTDTSHAAELWMRRKLSRPLRLTMRTEVVDNYVSVSDPSGSFLNFALSVRVTLVCLILEHKYILFNPAVYNVTLRTVLSKDLDVTPIK
jgi:hypothetical protein